MKKTTTTIKRMRYNYCIKPCLYDGIYCVNAAVGAGAGRA